MKTKIECEASVSAALAALVDDVQGESAQDLFNLMQLTISTCIAGMLQALGPQATRTALELSMRHINEREMADAVQQTVGIVGADGRALQ